MKNTEQPTSHNLVTIATFSQAPQAHVLRGRLESEGIPAFLADENTVTANWLYSTAVGGVKLQVREADAARAREVLGLEEAAPEDEEEDAEPDPTCPQCGSPNVSYTRYATRWVFASWLLLGFPLLFIKGKWSCGNCGNEWRE